MGVGKGMRWRKHCLGHPLALRRDFILLNRSFQLSLELLVPPVVVPHPSQFNPKPRRVPGVWLCWSRGGCASLPALRVGTRGVWGAQPTRAGAAKAALNSPHGASIGSRCGISEGKTRTAVTIGCKAQMRSWAGKPGLQVFCPEVF